LQYDDSLDAFGIHGVGGFVGALLTGVLVSAPIVIAATGSPAAVSTLIEKGRLSQIGVQAVAALAAAVYGFVGTILLVKIIDLVWSFRVSAEAENVGLDRSEHGEVGFDIGGATLDEVPDLMPTEPRPARIPPQGESRFTIIVEGPSEEELREAWSKLCQAGTHHPAEFRAIYPLVTTVQGNRFRFRGGDHFDVRGNMKRLFEAVLNTPVQTHVEE
jgi:hypothetical protein